MLFQGIILGYILAAAHDVTIDDIALSVGTSTRTIRRDPPESNQFRAHIMSDQCLFMLASPKLQHVEVAVPDRVSPPPYGARHYRDTRPQRGVIRLPRLPRPPVQCPFPRLAPYPIFLCIIRPPSFPRAKACCVPA